MNRKSISLFMILAITLLVSPITASAQEDAVKQKYFTLHKAEQDGSYTLYYPIEVDRPGEIVVSVKIDNLIPQPPNQNYEPLRLVMVDARAFKNMPTSKWKQWVNNANEYNPLEYLAGDKIRKWVRGMKRLFGKKEKKPAYYHGQMRCGKDREGYTENIRHGVDDPELRKTNGKYIIIFRNISQFKATGSIFISYPGNHNELDRNAEKMFECLPDLSVDKVYLNQNKNLVTRISNRGECAVHPARWHKKGPEAIVLLAKVGNRSYGTTLKAADPHEKTRYRRGATDYLFEKVKITASTKVTVTIDPGNKLLEESKQNNTKTIQLGPPKIQKIAMAPIQTKPDLRVSAIRLSNSRQVLVEISNAGLASLDHSLWSGSSQPLLNLKMNGLGWGNIGLATFDPNKKLARKAGKVVYNTKYVLKQNATVTAAIDSNNKINEANEGNNTLEVKLFP